MTPLTPRTRHRRDRAGDSGSATVELVLAVPMLMLALAFLALCGRTTDARLRVEDAAHQAARAASGPRSSAEADAQARSTAAEALTGAGIRCRPLEVHTQGGVQAGGTVNVAVTCHIDLSDLALLRVPGAAAISAASASPVDVYRGAV